MLEMESDLQELSWDDIPVASESSEVLPQLVEAVESTITFSISSLAQEIQVDITSSYQQWMNAEQYLTTNLALACLCHSGVETSNSLSYTSDFLNQDTGFNPIQGPESHEGHSCDECGGSIENGKCSKCGHSHHH